MFVESCSEFGIGMKTYVMVWRATFTSYLLRTKCQIFLQVLKGKSISTTFGQK